VHDRVEVPEPVTLVGVSVHVRPVAGLIVDARLTTPLKPWRGVTVTVDEAWVPARTVTLVGLAAIVKS